jgi:hypothetical protein
MSFVLLWAPDLDKNRGIIKYDSSSKVDRSTPRNPHENLEDDWRVEYDIDHLTSLSD